MSEFLLPSDRYKEVFEPLRDKKVVLYRTPEDIGDYFTHQATLQLCQVYNVQCTVIPYPDRPDTLPEGTEIVLVPGGASMGSKYTEIVERRQQTLGYQLPVVVLPQTYQGLEDMPYTKVYVQETGSLQYNPDAVVAPPLVLAYNPGRRDDSEPPKWNIGVFLRQDAEGMFKDQPNQGDPYRLFSEPEELLSHIAQYEKIRTDRVIIAILALMLKRHVRLLPNASHENQSIYKEWLKDLGCRWATFPSYYDERH